MITRFGVASWAAWLLAAYLLVLLVAAHTAEAQPLGSQPINGAFQNVTRSVVAIRARGRMAHGERFTERGSGVLISADGWVLTAAFLVHEMDEISVEFATGEKVSARVVVSEPAAADVSLLQLERVPPGAIVAPTADSNTVKVGDTILIVGAPHRGPHSLSVGSINARWAPNTAYRTMPDAEFFQTNAAIDVENSGGPMFNLQGGVIGIVSHNVSRGDQNDEQGFVVTFNTAKRLLLENPSAFAGFAPGSCSAASRRGC